MLATVYRSDALTATACWSRGLVDLAEGAPAAAVSPLREAVRRWHTLDLPYEAARARIVLAEAYRATEENDSAATELEAALAIFERLGAVAAARRTAALLRGDRGAPVAATFLFSDICGSTNLVEAIGDAAWLDLVDWHDRTLRALFSLHGGEEVDHAGDGFFVAFSTAGSALRCAVAIQQALAEHRRHHGYAPPVRIGVHSARAIQVVHGYRGKGIHAASRIGAVATADEVVASREAADEAGLRFSNPRTLELKRPVGPGRARDDRLGEPLAHAGRIRALGPPPHPECVIETGVQCHQSALRHRKAKRRLAQPLRQERADPGLPRSVR